MTTDLRTAIDHLAANFASSIVAAIRAGKLDDILTLAGGAGPEATPPAPAKGRAPRKAAAPAAKLAPAPTRAPAVRPARPAKSAPAVKVSAKEAGRLHRRSPQELAKALEKVVAIVKGKGGLRSEQIQKQLGMDKKELPRVLRLGLEKKALKSKGEKRSRTYSAA